MNDNLSHRIAAAARALSSEVDVQRTLEKSVTLATELLEGCDEAGVSVVYGRTTIETPACTSELVALGDTLQYTYQEGPCLDAIWDHETVSSPDLATETRWPKWAPRVVEELGVLSMLSFQLFATDDTLGALNLYSLKKDAFTAEDRIDGLALAAQVAVALAGAKEIEGLSAAVLHRTVIGQSQGILMERFNIDSHQAFAVLRRVSQDGNVKLYEVAAAIVQTRQVPGVEDGR